MKTFVQISKMIAVLVTLAIFTFACETGQQHYLEVSNPLDTSWADAPMLISRADLEGQLGEIPAGKIVAVMDGTKWLPSQYDDLDQDGTWDEMAFIVSLGAGESLQLRLSVEDKTALPEFETRTYLRFAEHTEDGLVERTEGARLSGTDTKVSSAAYQMEGPGWENDVIGFRNYFDERNGMDIFGKLGTDMAMEVVGAVGNYHEMQPWGMDVLKVGNSLGAGALALKYQDQVYRVTAPSGASFTALANGPIRAVFDLDFAELALGEQTVALKQRISIWPGTDGYKSEVSVSPVLEGLELVSGIVNMQSDSAYSVSEGEASVMYTHDKQAYDGEYLGMALIVPATSDLGAIDFPDEGEGIVSTYGRKMKLSEEAATPFWFYAGWEKRETDFTKREYFETRMREGALKASSVLEWAFK